jgi:predicted O-methyltransferase YrrM
MGSTGSPTLNSSSVEEVLARLFSAASLEDPQAKELVKTREAELGRRLGQAERYELYGEAPLAITPEVGRLLYALCLATRAGTIVEFGCSMAISTIHLAAALRDADNGGSVITTEILPAKAQSARQNLVDARLDDLVELRVGDAIDTLADLEGPVDFLFLDGRNDLYLTVLQLMAPRLAASAVVAADLSADDPDLHPYLEHVRDRRHGYLSTLIPLNDGVELSVRVPAR